MVASSLKLTAIVHAAGPIEALTPLAKPGDWRAWLRAACLLIASLLTLAAVTCFIAYNWQEFSRVGRIGLVSLGLVVSAGLAVWAGPASPARGPLLLLTFGLIGTLFALVGQVYQLGADSFGLFLNWALFASPLVLVSRAQVLWAAWLSVLWLGLFTMSRQAPELVSPLASILLDPKVSLLLAAAIMLALRQALFQRLAWVRPSLAPALLALAAILPWHLYFWLLLAPNFMIEEVSTWSFLVVWSLASLVLAASLLVSAFMRREALLTFVGIFWGVGVGVALGFRAILGGRPNALPDGLGSIFMMGLVIIGCFMAGAAVMRLWHRRYGTQNEIQPLVEASTRLDGKRDDQPPTGALATPSEGGEAGAIHWSVTLLRAFGGLVGGTLVTFAVVSLVFTTGGAESVAVLGLPLAGLCLFFSYRAGRKDPTSQSGTHAFLCVPYFIAVFLSIAWIRNGTVYRADFGDPTSDLVRFALLAFFVASAFGRIWRPGQVALFVLTLVLFVPELFRILSLEQTGVVLMGVVAASHFLRARWERWGYLAWAPILATLIFLEIIMFVDVRDVLTNVAANPDFSPALAPYLPLRLLVAVGLVGLALAVIHDRKSRGFDGWQLLPYAGLLIIATVSLPLMSIYAVMLMLGGRARESLVLEMMGWLALLVSLNHWYFSLSGTLLIKAGYLGLSAAVIWGIFAVLAWGLLGTGGPAIGRPGSKNSAQNQESQV